MHSGEKKGCRRFGSDCAAAAAAAVMLCARMQEQRGGSGSGIRADVFADLTRVHRYLQERGREKGRGGSGG